MDPYLLMDGMLKSAAFVTMIVFNAALLKWMYK